LPQTLNRSGEVVAPYDKGIVQQARHCWALSLAVASGAVQGEQAKRAERGCGPLAVGFHEQGNAPARRHVVRSRA
jgi:hypothetical protein